MPSHHHPPPTIYIHTVYCTLVPYTKARFIHQNRKIEDESFDSLVVVSGERAYHQHGNESVLSTFNGGLLMWFWLIVFLLFVWIASIFGAGLDGLCGYIC